jgi:hypothetical protein
MESISSDLSFAEYLVIFNTFIFGYVATQFFTGWSSVISHRNEMTISKEHLAWTIFAFALLTDIWWGSWSKTSRIVEHNYSFYISLLSPTVFYFLVAFLFPDYPQSSVKDLGVYLSSEFKRISFVFFLLFLSFFVGGLAFGNLMASDNYFNAAGASCSILLYFYRPVWLRRTVLVSALTLISVHIIFRASYIPGHQVMGFSFVEYLTVFITFIYGFVAARFLYGWSLILKNFRDIPCSREYIGWTALAFALMMDIWWNSWRRGSFIEASIVNFILSLSVPLMFYFFSAAILPVELLHSGRTNLREFFEQHRVPIFVLLGLILAFNTTLANMAASTPVTTAENMVRFTSITFAVIAIFFRHKWFHRAVLATGWLLLMIHTIIIA